MATIGSLAVNIIATTDKFLAGLNSANNAVARFVKKTMTGVNLIGGIGLYRLAAMAKEAIDTGGAMFDMAHRVGLSVEALSALDFGAEQAGVNIEAMHLLITRLSRVIGQAGTGSDEAAKAIGRIGLNYRTLLNLPRQQQFLEVIDALHSIPNDSIRAARAQAIFGRSASELNNLIAEGSAGLSKYSAELARNGALLTDEAAAKLDSTGDKMKEFNAIWAGTKRNIVADYAPEIVTAIDLITGAIKWLRIGFALTQAAIVGFIEVLLTTVNLAAKALNYLLPKSMELDTAGADEIIDSFTKKRQELVANAGKIYAGTEQKNPLATTGGAAGDGTEKNTAKIASTMDQLLSLMRDQHAGARGGGQQPATVAIAGVR